MPLDLQRHHFPGRTGGPNRLSSMGAVFFAVTGTLIATSIVNIGSSGVPVFYLAFLIPVIASAFPRAPVDWERQDSRLSRVWVPIVAVGIALIVTTVLQLVTIPLKDPGSEVMHLVSRLCFLVYFVIAQTWLREETLQKTLIWLRRLLIVACAYGVYQIAAKLLGWPLFLDWLRNNRSFYIYDYDVGGWVGIIRATSIYAEPSQATIPILVLFMLNLRLKSSSMSNFAGWLTLVLFTLATFSRGVWATLLVAAAASLLFRSVKLCALVETKRPALTAVVLVLLLVLPVWGFIRANSNDGADDLSAQTRSGGIVLGVHMIQDAPLLGFGWNSFGDVAQHYAAVPLDVDADIDFSIIHNTVISDMQQAGLSGFVLAALPFIVLIGWSTAPTWMTFCTLASFLVAAELGDIGYSSLTWLWLAILINMKSAAAEPPASRTEVASGRHSYKTQMSGTLHSTS